MNASDARNKSDGVGVKGKLNIAGKLSNRVKELVTNTAISLAGVSDTKSRRQVLVMDEVDGMSGMHLPSQLAKKSACCLIDHKHCP